MSKIEKVLLGVCIIALLIIGYSFIGAKAESPSPDMTEFCEFEPDIEWAYTDLEWMLEELCQVAFRPYFDSYFTNNEFQLEEVLLLYPTHFYGMIEFSGVFDYESSATALAIMVEEINHNVIPIVGEIRDGNVLMDFSVLAPHTAYTMYLFVGW